MPTDLPNLMKNVLITGGCGFIGSNFVRYMLAETEVHLTVLDKMTYAARKENLSDLWESDRLALVVGDIQNAELVEHVIDEKLIDTVVHFAAETHVDVSIKNPLLFSKSNVQGTHVLLEAARTHDLRFHQVGTDEVYGTIAPGKRSVEADAIHASSPYSASKAAADLLVLSYFTTFGLRATITRGANNVGPYQFLEKVVPLFSTNALLDQPLPMYGDGKYRRDYTHVQDHCSGILIVLQCGAMGEVYNVGTGQDISNIEMAELVLQTTGKPRALIRHVADRPGHDRRYCMSVEKLQSLGWAPRFTPAQAVAMAAKWYVDNRWWWEPLRSKSFLDYYDRQYSARLAGVQP